MEVSETTLLCAFDYAVGRQTYVVSEVTKDILYSADLISSKGKAYIVKEIERRWEVNSLGMEMDKKEWLKVLEALKSA